MKLRKLATIVANITIGLGVVTVGLLMLPFPLAMVWGVFNLWLWIAAPVLLLWTNRKEA